MRCTFSFGTLALLSVVASASLPAQAQDEPKLAPKVMVITMFGGEAKPWLNGLQPARQIQVPGLSKEFPNVACDDAGICQVTTSMGFAKAASSVSAVVLGNRFDLSRTYFLVAGIAGVDPTDGTLGSAHWARYVIDGGLHHEIDPRQIPSGWKAGVVPLGAAEPGQKAEWAAGTEVYRLNENLLQKAYALSKDVDLQDGEDAARYRQPYTASGSASRPIVSICDTLSSDTYWHGSMIANSIAQYCLHGDRRCRQLLHDPDGRQRHARRCDAVPMPGCSTSTGSLSCAPPPTSTGKRRGKTPNPSLTAQSGGFTLATSNAYRVGRRLVDAIVADWEAGRRACSPADPSAMTMPVMQAPSRQPDVAPALLPRRRSWHPVRPAPSPHPRPRSQWGICCGQLMSQASTVNRITCSGLALLPCRHQPRDQVGIVLDHASPFPRS